ncbi:hypothetical protein PCC7424_2004 [Gloeothece citriformis PCC 7424]|uniref:Uncharacterized protein n=1 Tax=Gloeothece citriformis (strain PCC 7424) TaxID=65393 RepID=B7KEX8_GLOC7|nr:hypothetical protein PCC7424_2004 [Gloeothece citriformis PCC 7424]
MKGICTQVPRQIELPLQLVIHQNRDRVFIVGIRNK